MFGKKIIVALAVALVGGAAFFVAPMISEAGRIGGPLVREGTAGGDDYDIFMVRFQPGKLAKVSIQNAGKCDLDLKIIDPATLRVVARDTRSATDARVQFFPAHGREYIVMVHNYTKNQTCRYVLFTN